MENLPTKKAMQTIEGKKNFWERNNTPNEDNVARR